MEIIIDNRAGEDPAYKALMNNVLSEISWENSIPGRIIEISDADTENILKDGLEQDKAMEKNTTNVVVRQNNTALSSSPFKDKAWDISSDNAQITSPKADPKSAIAENSMCGPNLLSGTKIIVI